jgi:filamentous hemagglutinin family protein
MARFDRQRRLEGGPASAPRLRFFAWAPLAPLSPHASVAVLLAAGLLICTQAWPQPVPRVPVDALPVGNSQKAGTPITYSAPVKNATTGLTTATITQTDASNIVDWKSFDIGRAAQLNIVQPSSSAVLLNKVSGGAFENKTVIDGVLNANGRVYLYNPNGIVFGKTGTVNVNSLIASSLKFDENRVTLGLLQPGSNPVLGLDPSRAQAPGAVVVEGDAQGRAALSVANGGLLLLAAPQVTNNGSLSAPDGQVMLAAGGKVYLAAPKVTDTGTSLRGLLVEVSNDDLPGLPAAGTRTVENGVTGSVAVGRGNATMIGYAVNQKGLVSASTSVNLNGSVYLLARDQAVLATNQVDRVASRTGPLLLGPGSVTQVLPDASDKETITASTVFNKSTVVIDSSDVAMQSGARVVAPGGNVTMTARQLVSLDSSLQPVVVPSEARFRIDMAPDSLIDVSGSTGTQLAMESNVINVDLRGTELADNVVLRDSPLYATRVNIDIRKGTGAANVSGWLGLVGQGLGQVNAPGGTVTLSADGAIIQRAGSKIAVDGGSVEYLAGHVNTTQLQLGDKLVDIGSAVSNTLYTAAVNLPDSAANFEAGYIQGSSAGSVSFNAPILVLQGGLSAKTEAGRYQREVGAAGYPQGGQLQIKASGDSGFYGKLVVGGQATQTASAPEPGQAFDNRVADQRLLASELDLDTAALARAGFSRIDAATLGNVEVTAPVALAAGGRLSLTASQSNLSIDGNVVRGGDVSVNAPVTIPGGSVTLSATGTLTLGEGVAVDLAGRWTNDMAQAAPLLNAAGEATEPLVLKGGKLSATAYALLVGPGFSADVSAGAWLNKLGVQRLGSAGSISLQVRNSGLTPGFLRLGSQVRLAGYGFGTGGSLSLKGRNVWLGALQNAASADDLTLAPGFFQQGGFSSYDVSAGVNLSVLANSVIAPVAQSWQLSTTAARLGSGAMASVATPTLRDLASATAIRPSTSLSLSAPVNTLADAGRLVVEAGARVNMDPGANLSLLAGRQMTVYGTLNAPGGNILFDLTAGGVFFAERSIWFGPSAMVLANGSSARIYTDGSGVSSGELLNGGSIRIGSVQNNVLAATDAYVVAQSGSQFSVDGIGTRSLSFKSGGGITQPAAVASSGGSIEIRASQGLLFAGALSGSSGGSGSSAGSLTVALEGDNHNGLPTVLTLPTRAPAAGIVPANLAPNQAVFNDSGQVPGDKLNGQGWLLAGTVNAGGFGRLDFKSKDSLSFGLGQAAVTLTAADAIVLDAPNLLADFHTNLTTGLLGSGNALTLQAAYVQLGSSDALYQTPDARASGNAVLKVAATNIDLIGNSAWQGFGVGSLAAAQDIRLTGLATVDANLKSTGLATGSLALAGNLTLTDAQTYPTTLSDFKLSVAAVHAQPGSGTLTFASNGDAGWAVLSAGGSLTAVAPHIIQAGRVLAPFGSLALGNLDPTADSILTQDLEYRAGSVTSVAGSGVVPLGGVSDGSVPTASAWFAALADGTPVSLTQNPVAGAATPERALPGKAIESHATSINAAKGATIDVSGGGSLYAYGFTPGKGGSKDVLDSSTVFAIIPNFKGAVAPIDGSYGSGGLQPGDSVTLTAMPGLAAGTYTLLPAHYALLPGAFSVSVAANSSDMLASANKTLADGAMLVAGRLDKAGSGSRSQGFVVSSGSVVRNHSEFNDFDATSYFKAKAVAAGVAAPELPVDGGRLVFESNGLTGTALNFNSRMLLGAATGGRAGMADISAPDIEIVAGAELGSRNNVRLVAADLNALGADSLVIGALREPGADGQSLTVGAQTVSLSNDAAHALTGADIVLAATGSVSLGQRAALQADRAPARAPEDLTLAGGGALLRVSGGAPVRVQRGAGAASSGVLDIGAGATVAASGSAYLDAGQQLTQAGSLLMGPGAALGFATANISLGADMPREVSAANGLALGPDALAGFGALSQLSFNSYGHQIGLYGSFDLGGAALQHLSLQGAGLLGHGGVVTLAADTVSLQGASASSTSSTAGPATSTAGALAVQAKTVEIGSLAFAVQGFKDVSLTAQGQIIATGQAGSFSVDNNLSLAAGRITTTAGSSASFDAAAALRLLPVAAPLAPTTAAGLGGALSFAGATVSASTEVVAPSGQVLVQARQGLLDISGGDISTAGQALSFGSTAAYAPGGAITLLGQQVALGAAAGLDVSAIGAAAGSLNVQAQGLVQMDGSLRGAAAAGLDGALPTQGQFTLQAGNAGASGAFGALNGRLNAAGFTESRQFRFAEGDVALGGSDQVLAHQVVIAADNGNIVLGGNSVIDASGAKGGSIELYAAQAAAGASGGQVTLRDQTLLKAVATATPVSAAGSAGNGGRVVMASSNSDGAAAAAVDGGASLHLDGGSIDVAGSSTERNGTVTLRAPRLASGSDVAVASLNTRISNSAATVIEGQKVYQATTVSERADAAGNLDATTSGQMYLDAAAFSGRQSAILSRLNAGGVALRAGIEVRSPVVAANAAAGVAASAGDLNVSVNEFASNAADRGWNLNAWRFNEQPIALTLRAAGNLNITGSISDGFVKPASTRLSMPDWALATGASANLQLVGGADLAAAHPLAVNRATTGDVHLGFADRTPTSAAPLSNTDAPVSLLRTGTGRIDIAAGRDVTLDMAKFYVNSSSDPAINGTPVIFDQKYSDNTYRVSVYGAAVYTAGAADTTVGTAAPLNALNTHYGAAADTLSRAAFGKGGGALTVTAGRDVTGPHNLSSSWYYLNGDGQAAVLEDKKNGVDASPAVPATVALLPRASSPLVNNWLFRQGRSQLDANGQPVFETLSDGTLLSTAWWSRTDYFNQALASLGGGDLSVLAGRNVVDVTASTATNAYVLPATLASTPVLKEQGGGDLLVLAAKDIQGGAFYVQKGAGTLRANGALGAGPASAYVYPGTDPDTQVTPVAPLNPVLALGDARFAVSAGQGLAISGSYNPTMTEQSSVNNKVSIDDPGFSIFNPGFGAQWNTADLATLSADDRATKLAYLKKYGQFSNFSTYGDDTALKLTAVTGALQLSFDALALASGKTSVELTPSATHVNGVGDSLLSRGNSVNEFRQLYALAPGTVFAAALSGDLASTQALALMPGSRGQLDLLAAGNLNLSKGTNGWSTAVRMLDNDPAGTTNVASPRIMTATDMGVLAGTVKGIAPHTLGGLHSGDSQPVRLVTLKGDIVGDNSGSATLWLPKATQISAGRDIVDLGLSIQQDSAADITRISAGRDFVDSTIPGNSVVANVVGGAGRVELMAGRHVDFGNGSGLVTRGNLDNPYLPDGGASVQIVAGTTAPDYPAWVALAQQYGSAYAVTVPADASALASFVRGLNPALPATASAEANWAAFRALPAADQARFLSSHPALANKLAADAAALGQALARGDTELLNARFFASLVETAKLGQKGADNKVIDSSLVVFDRFIATLFPGAQASTGGDISAFASQVKTEQGGAVDLFAPAGSVFAGLTQGAANKKAYEQGVFTIRGGAIRALVETDFLVNQGRVFTLGGGDISLVSQQANIDAGRGAKTASSAPPPLITIDPNGNVQVDVSGSISGSGIATLRTRPDQPASDVFAIAPRGIFDAGDAGVRSTGSVAVVAPVVLNAANISAGGSIAGAQVAVAAPALGSVAAPANAAPKNDELAKAASTPAASADAPLEVDALGHGSAVVPADEDTDEDDPRKKKKKK